MFVPVKGDAAPVKFMLQKVVLFTLAEAAEIVAATDGLIDPLHMYICCLVTEAEEVVNVPFTV